MDFPGEACWGMTKMVSGRLRWQVFSLSLPHCQLPLFPRSQWKLLTQILPQPEEVPVEAATVQVVTGLLHGERPRVMEGLDVLVWCSAWSEERICPHLDSYDCAGICALTLLWMMGRCQLIIQ